MQLSLLSPLIIISCKILCGEHELDAVECLNKFINLDEGRVLSPGWLFYYLIAYVKRFEVSKF